MKEFCAVGNFGKIMETNSGQWKAGTKQKTLSTVLNSIVGTPRNFEQFLHELKQYFRRFDYEELMKQLSLAAHKNGTIRYKETIT